MRDWGFSAASLRGIVVGADRLIIPFVARIAIVQWGLGNAADEPQHRGEALGYQTAEPCSC